MKKNNRSIFLFIGLLIISVSQIVLHFTTMPDFVTGSLMGIGIGIMLLAIIRPKPKAAC
jgi:hypothetical protein